MNKNIIKTIGATLGQHSPAILTGVGIAGMLTSVVLAVRATPKALKLIEKERLKKDAPLTPMETVKTAWKPYVPTAISCVLSATSLIFAQSVNSRRNAALMAAYEISENALKDYRVKAVDILGKEKEQEIRQAVNQEKLDKHFSDDKVPLIAVGNGDVRCYDPYSGRDFSSNMDKINKAFNQLNRDLQVQEYQSLNDFYYLVGLDNTEIGDHLGWNFYQLNHLLEPQFTSHITSNGTPCLVVGFNYPPEYEA